MCRAARDSAALWALYDVSRTPRADLWRAGAAGALFGACAAKLLSPDASFATSILISVSVLAAHVSFTSAFAAHKGADARGGEGEPLAQRAGGESEGTWWLLRGANALEHGVGRRGGAGTRAHGAGVEQGDAGADGIAENANNDNVLEAELNKLMALVLRDFVDEWYRAVISPDDVVFQAQVRQICTCLPTYIHSHTALTPCRSSTCAYVCKHSLLLQVRQIVRDLVRALAARLGTLDLRALVEMAEHVLRLVRCHLRRWRLAHAGRLSKHAEPSAVQAKKEKKEQGGDRFPLAVGTSQAAGNAERRGGGGEVSPAARAAVAGPAGIALGGHGLAGPVLNGHESSDRLSDRGKRRAAESGGGQERRHGRAGHGRGDQAGEGVGAERSPLRYMYDLWYL